MDGYEMVVWKLDYIWKVCDDDDEENDGNSLLGKNYDYYGWLNW